MTFRMIAFAAALGLAGAAHAAPQAMTPPAAKGMTYDCTKAGNKNKAACKNVTPAATAAPMATAKSTTTTASASTTKPMMPTAATKPAKPMNYDCTKAGNKDKAACKTVVVPPAAMKPAAPVAAPAAPMAKPAAPMATTVTKTRTAASTKPVNPNEVTATLKNGQIVHYDCSKAGNKDKKACGAK